MPKSVIWYLIAALQLIVAVVLYLKGLQGAAGLMTISAGCALVHAVRTQQGIR